jgi:hypothetical protein
LRADGGFAQGRRAQDRLVPSKMVKIFAVEAVSAGQ